MKNTIKAALTSAILLTAVSCDDTISAIGEFGDKFDAVANESIDAGKVETALDLLKTSQRIIIEADLSTLTKVQDEFTGVWSITVEGTVTKDDTLPQWSHVGKVVVVKFTAKGLMVIDPSFSVKR